MKKIIKYTVYLIIIFIILYLFFNFKIYIVTSGSMYPTLKTNELIVVKLKDNKSEYKVGDIITYCDSDIVVTHRIIEISNNLIYTKGDFNNTKDIEPITTENIIGKVLMNSYFLGYIYVNYKFHIVVSLILLMILTNSKFMKKGEKNE